MRLALASQPVAGSAHRAVLGAAQALQARRRLYLRHSQIRPAAWCGEAKSCRPGLSDPAATSQVPCAADG